MLGVCLVAGCQPASPPRRPWSRWRRISPPGACPSWCSRSGAAHGAPRAAKVPAGAAEKVYDYAPGVAVEVPVALGQPLDIVLEAGEQVRQIVDGDRAPAEQGQARRWEVKEGGEGVGDGTPAACVCHGGRGRLDQRRDHHDHAADLLYHLQECGEVPVRVLRWHYPPRVRPPRRARDARTAAAPGPAEAQYHVATR